MDPKGFRRCDGFVGSVPQNFINANMPSCPLCGSPDPYWTLKDKMEFTSHRIMFRCQHCGGVLSATNGDFTGTNKSSAYTALTTGGMFDAMVKRSQGKDVKTTYLRVEDVGNARTTYELQGQDLPIHEFHRMVAELRGTPVQPQAPAPGPQLGGFPPQPQMQPQAQPQFQPQAQPAWQPQPQAQPQFQPQPQPQFQPQPQPQFQPQPQPQFQPQPQPQFQPQPQPQFQPQPQPQPQFQPQPAWQPQPQAQPQFQPQPTWQSQPGYRPQPAWQGVPSKIGSKLPRAAGYALIPMILLAYAALVTLINVIQVFANDIAPYMGTMYWISTIVVLGGMGVIIAEIFMERKPLSIPLTPIGLLAMGGITVINTLTSLAHLYGAMEVLNVFLSLVIAAAYILLGLSLLPQTAAALGKYKQLVAIIGAGVSALTMLITVIRLLDKRWSDGVDVLLAFLMGLGDAAVLMGAWLFSEQKGIN